MKKIYNSPEFEEIMFSVADLITASFLSMGEDNESNGKYGNVEGLSI